MEYGIALASNIDAWKTVRRAEELGFTHAWFYDSQLLVPDVFISIALAAEHTSKIKLGPGILVPTNRIAPSAANALATLNALAPGRIVCGLGTGHTARYTMGLSAQPLSELREYLRILRGMLCGETVEMEFPEGRRKIRFLNPELGLINLREPVAMYLSAFAPKARALAVECCDGWINAMFDLERALGEAKIIAETCRSAGRREETFYRTVLTLGRVLEKGEPADSPQARMEAGPLAMLFLHNLVEGTLPQSLPKSLASLVEDYRRLYQTFEPADARYLQLHRMHLLRVRPEEERFATAELLSSTTFTAEADELRARIRLLHDAGYQQLVIQLVPGHESALERWARLFALG
jgi:5,10-methylenetetrahydromethanopterin reductase